MRETVRVQRTGQLMYELLMSYPAISGLQPEYGWETSSGETADGPSYGGPHPNSPRHRFAPGGPPTSGPGAFLAAPALARAPGASLRAGLCRPVNRGASGPGITLPSGLLIWPDSRCWT